MISKTQTSLCAAGRLLAAVTLAMGASEASAAVDSLNIEQAAQRVNDLIVTHRYRDAERELLALERAHPDSPTVHTQKAVLYYTWIDDYGIADSLAEVFLTAVSTTIELSDSMLQANPEDARTRFCRGSVLAYRSLFRSYTEGIRVSNIPSLIRDATAGIGQLERAFELDSGLADALIGIGKYEHWKAQKFPWPFATRNDARKGVRLLERAVEIGVDWEAGALQTLGWAYIAEKRYDDALALALPMIERYPDTRFFKEIAGRAHLAKKQYGLSEQYHRDILDNLMPEERASGFIVMKYERWIAQIEQERGNYRSACITAMRLRRLDFTGVHPDWLRRKIGRLTNIQTESCPRAMREQ